MSVSQACNKLDLVGIFTSVDCRFYDRNTIMQFLKLISENGIEVMRGRVENGLYIQESN
jgi:hypothetical protein